MNPDQINRPEIVAEVRCAFYAYEAALMRNDVDTLNEFFWESVHTVRYGIAEQHSGIEAIRRWRARALPLHPTRRLLETTIMTFGGDSASVCTQFVAADTADLGRQTQTWIRLDQAWRIVAAHVSLIAIKP